MDTSTDKLTHVNYTHLVSILILLAGLYACDRTPEQEVLDGVLEVPENRNDPNSRTLKLVYKVLKATVSDPSKAPIVYLQGGPGMPTLIMEEFWANHPLRNDRDIVLMDQRGTGASEAFCSNLGESMFEQGAKDHTVEQAFEAITTVLVGCKEEIAQKGIDLQGYNSREIAADFEDLRKALGYEQWNIYGASYGSRLGFTMMRDFPESIRSAILLGVSPPDHFSLSDWIRNIERSLLKALQLCEDDEICNGRYPNLKERLRKVLLKMQTEPLLFEYEEKPFVLNAHQSMGLILDLLYDRNSMGNVPRLIEALEMGHTRPIVEMIASLEPIYDVVNLPMAYSVISYEEFPFYDKSEIDQAIEQAEFGFAMSFYQSEYKLRENWHPYRASSIENQPVVSDIPTLLLSGALDPVTPPGNATSALKYLENGYEVVFANECHDFVSNPCFQKITEGFINNPFQKPDLTCVGDRGPIEWNMSESGL